MENKSNPLSLKAALWLIAFIPLQLLFWALYHTLHAGGALESKEMATLALIGGVYLILALGLWRRKKWAHRISVIMLVLMSLTSIIKLMKGLSHPSPGYLLFLVSYLSSLVCLLSPSARESFSKGSDLNSPD